VEEGEGRGGGKVAPGGERRPKGEKPTGGGGGGGAARGGAERRGREDQVDPRDHDLEHPLDQSRVRRKQGREDRLEEQSHVHRLGQDHEEEHGQNEDRVLEEQEE